MYIYLKLIMFTVLDVVYTHFPLVAYVDKVFEVNLKNNKGLCKYLFTSKQLPVISCIRNIIIDTKCHKCKIYFEPNEYILYLSKKLKNVTLIVRCEKCDSNCHIVCSLCQTIFKETKVKVKNYNGSTISSDNMCSQCFVKFVKNI